MAQVEDDELAVAALDKEKTGGAPAVSGWTTEASMLAAVVDRLGEVVAAVVGSAGGKPPKIRPLPRPRTALDRARTRVSRQKVNALVAEVEAAQKSRR